MNFFKNDLITLIILVTEIWAVSTTSDTPPTQSTVTQLEGLDLFIDIE